MDNDFLDRSLPLIELDGVVCGFADPEAASADWRNRWRLERQRLLTLSERSRTPTATGAAAERLQALARAYDAQRAAVETLLAPLLTNDRGGSRETLNALRTRLPSHHAPSSYDTNLCRDWVWGQAENAEAARWFNVGAERVLVLGSGAGGLAYELARSAAEVVALDSNPLLTFAAQRMNGGKAATFYEFPRHPVGPGDVAVRHELQPQPRLPHLHHVWADALHTPFVPEYFDVVITHWLVDVIDAPLATLAGEINRLLKPGGQWLNQGTLAFDTADPTANITTAEIAEVLAPCGFSELMLDEFSTAYLRSPHARGWRQEHLVCWRAERTARIAAKRHEHRPNWLVRTQTPVPALDAFQAQAMTTRIHAFVMAMIDGSRSIDDMSAEMERQNLMPKAEARSALRQMLETMWEEAQRSA